VDRLASARPYPPTVRELCSELGVSSTNGMGEHLKALSRKGLVTWEPKRSRTLSLTAAGRAALEGRKT
jgi:repressor LexA